MHRKLVRLPLDTYGCIVGVRLSQARYYFKSREALHLALEVQAERQAADDEARRRAAEAEAAALRVLSWQEEGRSSEPLDPEQGAHEEGLRWQEGAR